MLCGYQKLNPYDDKENPVLPPMCAVNNQLCTLCVLGNGNTYKEASRATKLCEKQKEKRICRLY